MDTSNIFSHNIWHTSDKEIYYLIPDDFNFSSGEDTLFDLTGRKIEANIQELKSFEMHPQVIQEFLEIAFRQLIKQSKNAFLLLTHFSHHRQGKKLDRFYHETLFDQLISSGLGSFLPSEMTENLASSSTEKTEKEPIPDALKSVFSQEEQGDIFKAAMQQMQKLGIQLDESITKNPEDPEKWIEMLNQHFFGEIEKEKKEKRKQQRKQEIQQSIAEGLRAQGIIPADDLHSEES